MENLKSFVKSLSNMLFQPIGIKGRLPLRNHGYSDDLDALSIRFILDGLAPNPDSTEVELYLPQTREGPAGPPVPTLLPGAIEQHSTSSVWKGPITHIREIYHWEKCLRACLENLLAMTLLKEFRQAAKRQIVRLKPRTAGRMLCHFANSAGRKTFHIVLEDLLTDMIELYNNEFADADQSVFALYGDLRDELVAFLRTHDCFQEVQGVYMLIDVDLHAACDGPHKVNLTGTTTWKHPSITFISLKTRVLAGEPVALFLHYDAPLMSDAYPCGVTPEYCIDSNDMPWQWITGSQGFVCEAPISLVDSVKSSPLKHNTSKSKFVTVSDIKAILDTHFPGRMKHERISRIRVRLEIAAHDDMNSQTWRRDRQFMHINYDNGCLEPRYDFTGVDVSQDHYSATTRELNPYAYPPPGPYWLKQYEIENGEPFQFETTKEIMDREDKELFGPLGYSTVHGYPSKTKNVSVQRYRLPKRASWQALVVPQMESTEQQSERLEDLQERADSCFDADALNAALSHSPAALTPPDSRSSPSSESEAGPGADASGLRAKTLNVFNFTVEDLPSCNEGKLEVLSVPSRQDSLIGGPFSADIDGSPGKEQTPSSVRVNALDGTLDMHSRNKIENELATNEETKPDQKDIRTYFEQCLAKTASASNIAVLTKDNKDLEEEKVYESFFLDIRSSGANSSIAAVERLDEDSRAVDDQDSMLGSNEDLDMDMVADME
ncbi:hypothetical protein EJ05DRAFT_162766 [Pseudovirgaria hyperparasitica]|uniref:Uncharacterized protein n=1 Tax=Pseudovirgaria hyperparasitica TaxID=470096 RepID=A0A6A6VVY9_9PEZI|nr:uncharacterized protein EJ05DRAFT_162766 [Pseudovirgaria hyperparasitica]KAF2754029.1 hypothetical protein EJ05DRAFT_162766 [Pseudovirgaria hyperparasitica]